MATYTEECSKRHHTFTFTHQGWKTSSVSLHRMCTTCQPCVICHQKGSVRVNDKPYCSIHCREAEEQCKRNDPTTRDDLYGLFATPSETKWMYVGKRLKEGREIRMKRYFSTMKHKDDFIRIEKEARTKAKENARKELEKKREALLEAAREYKKAKEYLEAHIDFVEDKLSYTV